VTSHGKSACDGVGGILKRLAPKSSLRWPQNDQVMKPHQPYQPSRHKFNSDFLTENEY
jgi:hypothetical protein